MAELSKSVHYMYNGQEKVIKLYEVGTPDIPDVGLHVNVDGEEAFICCVNSNMPEFSKAELSDIFVKLNDTYYKMASSFEA